MTDNTNGAETYEYAECPTCHWTWPFHDAYLHEQASREWLLDVLREELQGEAEHG